MATRTLYDENGQPVEVEFPDDDGGSNQGDQGSQGGQRSNAEWAQLRQQQKAAKALERENAFLKVGINPDDKDNPMVGYFAKGYDGPLEADAIKAAATAAGIIGKKEPAAPPATETKPGTPADQQGDDGGDGTPAPPTMGDPDAERRIFEAAIGAGLDDPTFTSAKAKLEEAARTGGTAAMVAAVREMGLPVNDEY